LKSPGDTMEPIPFMWESSQKSSAQSNESPMLKSLDRKPDADSAMVLVINHKRRIVYANRNLLDFICQDSGEKILGLRFGEAFKCENSLKPGNVCGTTENCKGCGILKAIISSEIENESLEEYGIIKLGKYTRYIKTQVHPFELDGQHFTFFTINDITPEHQKDELEQIFFHDLLNTASCLYASAQILKITDPGKLKEKLGQVTDIIYKNSISLVDEIKEHRELIRAENDELSIHPQGINSLGLLNEVASLYKNHEVGKNRTIIIDPRCNEIRFMSDRTLLGRIIGNMIKNALESSESGDTITLGCEKSDGTVRFRVHNPGFMSPDIQRHVFQLSFSTKRKGRGFGTYSIKLLGERYLNCKVSFTSSPEEGTTFNIYCPLDISSF